MDVLLKKAIQIAANGFEGVTDLCEVPHIFHNLYILNKLSAEEDAELLQIAALVGVVEHSDRTPLSIRLCGFSEAVCSAIELLSEDSVTDYRIYSLNVAGCTRAATILKLSERYYARIAHLGSLSSEILDSMTIQNKVAFLFREA